MLLFLFTILYYLIGFPWKSIHLFKFIHKYSALDNPLRRPNTNTIREYNYLNFSFITIASLCFKLPCSECQSKEFNLHEQFVLCCMGRYMFIVTFCHFTFECNSGLRSMIFYDESVILECDSLSLYFYRYPNLIRHHTIMGEECNGAYIVQSLHHRRLWYRKLWCDSQVASSPCQLLKIRKETLESKKNYKDSHTMYNSNKKMFK